LLKQKVAQNIAIILGYFILSKNHNEPNWQKITQSGHPEWGLGNTIATTTVVP
jgi:hypothetical protein